MTFEFQKEFCKHGYVATTDCVLAYLDSDGFGRLMEKYLVMKRDRQIEFIKKLPYLVISKKGASNLIDHFETKKFQLNETVWMQGTKADKILIVKKGEFVITRRLKDSRLALPTSQNALVRNKHKE